MGELDLVEGVAGGLLQVPGRDQGADVQLGRSVGRRVAVIGVAAAAGERNAQHEQRSGDRGDESHGPKSPDQLASAIVGALSVRPRVPSC